MLCFNMSAPGSCDVPCCESRLKTEQDVIETFDNYYVTIDEIERIQIKTEIKATEERIEKLDPETYVDNNTLDEDTTEFLKGEDVKNVAQLPENMDIVNGNDGVNSSRKKDIPRQKDQVLHSEAERGLFSCCQCDYTTDHKFLLNKHMETHTNEKNIYSCCSCNYQTYLKKLLIVHMRLHTENDDGGPKSSSSKTPTSRLNNCIRCNTSYKSRQGLNEHILKKHPELIASVKSNIHECGMCIFKTTKKSGFDKHMSLLHPTVKYTPKSRQPRSEFLSCKHCNGVYKSKQLLDNHVLKKHPEFIESITSKIHECKICTYKTPWKGKLDRHLLKHPEVKSSYKPKFNLKTCAHCSATFKTKPAMNEHIIRKHPECIESLTSKVHECNICLYKTAFKTILERHMSKHSGANSSSKPIICSHCNAEFKSKKGMGNHILKDHPKFIESITTKIHECEICMFKTTSKTSFDTHMLKHSGKNFTCEHCSAVFKSRRSLDNHVLIKHPEFSKLFTRKIYECKVCMYKSTIMSHLLQHELKHSGEPNHNCIYCDLALKSRSAMDDHVLKKHPEFAATVQRKIHECEVCSFKTIFKKQFVAHSSKHL